MLIKKLNMTNFRNYLNTEIEFGNNLNVIHGNNAQGKTNILEAIFLCASARSHRTSKDRELINVNEKSFHIGLEVIKTDQSLLIEMDYAADEKKKVRINEIPLRKLGDLMGNLNAVMFSPEDMKIVKEGPSERRRMVDITMSQIRPSYFFDLQQYHKIMQQRNNLFRAIKENRSLLSTLDIWNENLVKSGLRLIKARNEYIERLCRLSEKNHFVLTDNKEQLNITYKPSVKAENLTDLKSVEKNFVARLEASADKELLLGTTLTGPHRDDYELTVNGSNVKVFGSQGQQRTTVLSLKLSEVDIMTEETGERPVLLLDDVLSELDGKRQSYLLNSINNVQTLVTSTEKVELKQYGTKPVTYLYISNGEVILEK